MIILRRAAGCDRHAGHDRGSARRGAPSFRRGGQGPLSRTLLARLLRSRDVVRGIDERDMGEGLRKIAQQALGAAVSQSPISA
jgi:hypothetical protein